MEQDMQPKISVIIPVFNGEAHLQECLNSLSSQTFMNYECIFMNDGSSDHTEEILRTAAEKDHRIRVYTQKNAGSSMARRAALPYVKGKIVCFLDSDDYLEPGALSVISDSMRESADILCFGSCVDFVGKGRRINRIPDIRPGRSKEEIIADLFSRDSFNPLWNKAYRAGFLLHHEDWFPTGFSQGEDFIFNCHAFSAAASVSCIDAVLYHYLKRNEETLVSSFTKDSDMILDRKKAALQLLYPSLDSETARMYLFKEYEIFTINQCRLENHTSYQEKKEKLKAVVLAPNTERMIGDSRPEYFYGKVFRFLCGFHSAGFLTFSYICLNWIQALIRRIQK